MANERDRFCEVLRRKEAWRYERGYFPAELHRSKGAVRSPDRVKLREGHTADKYRRLQTALLRKKALRTEVSDMLDAIPKPSAPVPNPVRVKLREKLLRLDEKISELRWELIRMDGPDCDRRTAQRLAAGKPFLSPAAEAGWRKLENPAKYTTMTLAETMAVLGKKRTTIYRWLEVGKLVRSSGGRKPGERGCVLIRTSSVAKFLEEGSE
jgi:hypothetical protein